MNQTELEYKRTNGLAPFAYAQVDEWLYFCDQHIPGLFRYHYKKDKCECVVGFNTNYINMNFYKIISYKNELWLLPFLDGKIVRFDINTRKVFYYDVPKRIEEKVIPFIDMIFFEENAYILPHGNNRILIEVDLLTYGMQEIQLLEKEQNNKPISFCGAVQFKNQIYLTESSKKIFILFDIPSKGIKILFDHKLPYENLWLKRIGHKIFFFPITINKNEKLMIYNIDNNCFFEEKYPIKNLSQGEVCITLTSEKKIWVLANKEKKIFQINQELKIESEIKILKFNEDEKIVYISGVEFSDRIFWNGNKGRPLIQIKDGISKILDVSRGKSLLKAYIEMVKKSEIHEENSDKLNIGKAIYDNTVLYNDAKKYK